MKIIHSILFLALFAMAAVSSAAEFKSAADCVAGKRVMNRRNEAGKITKATGSMCTVLWDSTSKEVATLFWMLRPEGDSRETSDKLVNGVYKCYSLAGTTLNYMFLDVHITGSDSYQDQKGNAGKYSIESSGKIVFSSGPLQKANGKLLRGPKIGLNMNGGTFFNTTCGMRK
jgi:hypothetical protein